MSATKYDSAFQKVEGLTWLPWVGNRYETRSPSQRLLVVGESHYFRGDTPEAREIDRNGYDDPMVTREMVREAGWGTRTWKKLPKLLFNASEFDHGRFWDNCAYYNFVQRPMDNYIGERPSNDDFASGWPVFERVLKILRPSTCLFIGVSAAPSYPFGSMSKRDKVAGVFPRVAMVEADGFQSELIFVHHLGRCHSSALSEWNDYLRSEHSSFMNWIGAEFYAEIEDSRCEFSG